MLTPGESTAHAHSTYIIQRLGELDGDVHMIDPWRRHPHIADAEVIHITCRVGKAVETTDNAPEDRTVHGMLGTCTRATSYRVGGRTATVRAEVEERQRTIHYLYHFPAHTHKHTHAHKHTHTP